MFLGPLPKSWSVIGCYFIRHRDTGSFYNDLDKAGSQFKVVQLFCKFCFKIPVCKGFTAGF